MNTNTQEILQFPCTFPIKIMGNNNDDFVNAIINAVKPYLPNIKEEQITTKQSAKGNYLAATLTFHATSKEQLDNIYRALTSCEYVKVVL